MRVSHKQGAPWIVLLHQSPSSSVMFEALMPHLSDKFSILAPDNPGFGQSDPLLITSIPGFAASILACMDVFQIEKAHVFGHHTGAAIGVALARAFPQRFGKLALCGPPALSAHERRKLVDMAPVETLEADGSHFSRVWTRLRAKDTGTPAALSTRELGLAFAASQTTKAAYQAVADYDFLNDLAALETAPLMFAGERDSLIDALPLARTTRPDAEVVILADAGGYVCDRDPERVAALLIPFFEGGTYGP